MAPSHLRSTSSINHDADAVSFQDTLAVAAARGQSSSGSTTGRILQDGTCLCSDNINPNDDGKAITVRMLSVGGADNHYLNFVSDRFSHRAPAFFQREGINVEVVRIGDLGTLNHEIIADVQAKVYDGYIFLPFITGTLVEQDGLADLTDFVATNRDVHWPDIYRFNREVQSVYDNVVRLLPCDGDVHSLFYRKDLFEQYNITVPRTWDEYTAVAEFFHGKQVPAVNDPNTTVAMTGSCVGRAPTCIFFNILVHSSSTQAAGTKSGALFDPATFEPLMGEAMVETLRHLENQIKYGAANELTSPCGGINVEYMNQGTCAMTYMWGDSFARHLFEGSVVEGRLGIAPTPGATKVLNRATGALVDCTPELCPHGEDYADIGRVNRAPYAAAGGWSAGVSAGVSPERQEAMAAFFGYACGHDESIDDVIPNAQGPLFTGTDPYRESHFNISKWVEHGYPKETTELYRDTIHKQLSSPNTVLDVRFPDANGFLTVMHDQIFAHLNDTLTDGVVKTHEDRVVVANSIAYAWRNITVAHDNRPDISLPLKSIYQKSLNVYTPPNLDEDDLSGGAIAGIVVGCSLLVAILTGTLAYLLIKREQKKSSMQWLVKNEELRLTSEVLGEGTYGAIVKGYIRGTPVAVKTSRHTMARLDSGGAVGSASDTIDASVNQSSKFTTTQLREDLSALVKLPGPHIVQTIGAMVEKKTIFVVLEFMEYGSLSTVLSDAAGIAAGEGRNAIEMQWAIQIARGLDYLHSVPPPLGPLLHTELRATNILIDSSYNAKITNFALESRVVGSRRDQGALLWMAPEVLNGAPAGTSSDVYSYGMVLYEIVARCRPFRVRQFSTTNLTEYTISSISEVSDDITPAALIEGNSQIFKGRVSEYFGEENGEKRTVPELVSRISDLTIEPPVRPDLPAYASLYIRDLCVESWNKNPSRRPTITEIVERLSRDVSPSSLTSQLAKRSSVFDSILPHDVQEMLARNETVPPKSYPCVTVIFSDVVGFTATSSLLTAEEVGDLIRRLFSQYDSIAQKYGVRKLDVIGDAFLGVAGIPNEEPDHAVRAAAFALEAIEEAKKTLICLARPDLGRINIRFGLATGPVVATVIGSALHPKFTVFGTTVNTASRMESSSEANKTQCTVETAVLLKEQAPTMGVHFRRKMEIKGRGELETYFLTPPAEGFKRFSLNKKKNARRSMGPIRLSQQSLLSQQSTLTDNDPSRISEEGTSHHVDEVDPPNTVELKNGITTAGT